MGRKLLGRNLLAKYRPIVLAITGFLICDLTVLALNLYSATRAEANAVLLNFTRQARETAMEIPRLTADLRVLELSDTRLDAAAADDLRKAVTSFSRILQVLRDGGEAEDEQGNRFRVESLRSEDARKRLEDISVHWAEPKEHFDTILKQPSFQGNDINEMYSYATLFSETLYDSSTALIADAQNEVRRATLRLQLAQIGGFSLALINFVYTIFMSLRSLVANDRRLLQAQQETEEILANVREGLFLLDPKLCVGGKYSASMQEIFREPIAPGADFLAILGRMVPPATLESARDYLQLLFGDRVKEALVQTLNPLSEVEVQAGAQSRFLSFQFNRVIEGGAISHLLVTVQDATSRVQLAAELQVAKSRARSELEVYLRLFGKDVSALRRFHDQARATLAQINDRLRAASERGVESYDSLVRMAFRGAHTIKGEAAAVGLDLFEALAHEFENELAQLRDRGKLGGEDMLKLTVRLDELFERLAILPPIIQRQAAIQPGTTPAADAEAAGFAGSIRALCERLARSQGKKVRLVADLAALSDAPEPLVRQLRELSLQLVRNAVSHGIETPQERLGAGKPETGTVLLHCARSDDESLEFSVRDDGRGLEPGRIRAALLRDGRCSEQQLGTLSDREVVMKIFEPGFSTQAAADADSGRGVGLDIVNEAVRSLGGKLRLSSRPQQFTEFSIRVEAATAMS